MNAHASPSVTEFGGDGRLAALLAALAPHAAKPLVLDYAGRTIGAGYHVTEVKAGAFVTLDCGGNPYAWHETVLQVEDLPAPADGTTMAAGKFRAILDAVAARIGLEPEARLTFEIGQPGEPMRVFDAGSLHAEDERVVLRLVPRPAICKPRHRAEAVACCEPGSVTARCCA